EAGLEAARKALSALGRTQPALGFVFASHDFPIQAVLSGVTSQSGDTPLIGMSTPVELSDKGHSKHSVVVAFLGGSDIRVRAEWIPGFADEGPGTGPRQASQKLLQSLQGDLSGKGMLLIADGVGADAEPFVKHLSNCLAELPPDTAPIVAGCLSPGDLRHARTYQVGRLQSGSGGLASAVLSGDLCIGIGTGHGWLPVGTYYKITQTRGLWIRQIDGKLPSEVYATTFGCTPRDWGFPPLNEMVRIYALGIEQKIDESVEAAPELIIRSPIRMENDGSMRMNTAIPEGSTAHLLVGSAARCLEAARKAASQALENLQSANRDCNPTLALVLVDKAWQSILTANPGEEIQAVRSVIGPDVPIIGGYSFGQIASLKTKSPDLLNQHILVVLFGS
ncbi:MAG: hypothetical protein EHM41_11495, partial [Chloroflexi bacterium]